MMGKFEELKACPFCGGKAEQVYISEGENAGGSCICCASCLASGNVEFERKENFVSNWNRRTSDPALLARIEALEAENGRLLEALTWYGQARNWRSMGMHMSGRAQPSSAVIDGGDRARAALAQPVLERIGRSPHC
jgi:Lar family restriction alleviation protein